MTQQDAAVRVAELEAQLHSTRRDYQTRLGELARRVSTANEASLTSDVGLYEMLLGQERERQDLQNERDAEQRKRIEVQAEHDATAQQLAAARAQCDGANARIAELSAERDRLAADLHEAHRWAGVLEHRAQVLQASLAWRVGRAIIAAVKSLPGARLLARLARAAR